MSLQTRTQEVDGHLCTLSREMNQGLKKRHHQHQFLEARSLAEKATAWDMGGGDPQHYTRSKTAWGWMRMSSRPSEATASTELTGADGFPPSSFSMYNVAIE